MERNGIHAPRMTWSGIHAPGTPSTKNFSAYLVVLWLCALAVTCVSILCTSRLFTDVPHSVLPQRGEKPQAEFSASALEKYLDDRARTLATLQIIDTGTRNSSAEYLTRPAILLRSVSILGDRRVAVVAVEGEKQTAVVGPGDEIAGVKILTIEPNGINCEWREQKFFVPM